MPVLKNKSYLFVATALSAHLLATPAASADPFELSASAGVASIYLWRGLDLGDGSPAVFGDLTASVSGFYATAWASSGDDTLGQEYNLIGGWGGEVGGLGIDLSLLSYMYPDETLNNSATNFGDLTEAILTLSHGPVSFTYIDNIAGDSGYAYYTLGVAISRFSVAAGHHDFQDKGADMTHLDITYAYNDRLSFTISQVIDEEDEQIKDYDDELNFVVSYQLPLEL